MNFRAYGVPTCCCRITCVEHRLKVYKSLDDINVHE